MELDSETQTVLTAFLGSKERNKFIIDWLVEDHDIPKWQAKGMVKLVLAPLTGLASDVARRGISKINDLLKKHSKHYDKVAMQFSKLLLIKLECKRTKQKYSEQYLKPPKGENPENWKQLNEQTKVWIKQLEQLDLITLSLGEMKARVRLNMDPPQLKKDSAPSRWLVSYNNFIPLIGRESETTHLSSWLNEEQYFSWKIITGDGGMGKTRLAQELAEEYIEAEWDCGFLHHMSRLVDHPDFENWMPLTNTLVIVDYAAAKQESLQKLLYQCASIANGKNEQEEPGMKLRLLLLERHADAGKGWVEEVQKVERKALKHVIADTQHDDLKLQPPQQKTQNETLVEILQATLNRWGELTNKVSPALPTFTEEDYQQIWNNTEGRPLHLQMAALHACEINSAQDIARWNKSILLDSAVEREREYIEKLCSSSSPKKLVERLAALLYFAGSIPVNHPHLLRMIQAEAQICGHENSESAPIIETLAQLFQHGSTQETGFLEPIQPDLVGAAFSATVLQEQGNPIETLDHAIQLAGETTWANLLRSAQDLYGVGNFELETWLPSLLDGRPKNELWEIAKTYPKQTVALRFFAVSLCEAMLKQPASERDEAGILSHLGSCYSDLGMWEKALKVSLKAVTIYERMTKTNPDTFGPDLALGLNNLSIRYTELGKREEALETALKSVAIYERLVGKGLEVFEPALALCFSNLGNRYSDLDRQEEALETNLKAVAIYEHLVDKDLDAFEPGLAISLSNLSIRYIKSNRQEEAIETSFRALTIHERLSKKNSDAFEPDLVWNLINLSGMLVKTDETITVPLRAVAICERMAKKNRDAFEPDLALSLCNLGGFYHALGKGEDAFDAILKSFTIREQLAKKSPDKFEPDLAESLEALGIILLQKNDAEQALEHFVRGIQVLNRLFQSSPQVFAGSMQKLVKNYLKSCAILRRESDRELIDPILQKLQELG
jgi:tetratricopeptide (TPR) repeat protein